MRPSGYTCFKLYLSLKLHFSDSNYDAIKYNFKVSASRDSYEARNDHYCFEKLSNHSDPSGLLLSNIIHYGIDSLPHIREIVNDEESKEIYTRWLARKEALEYFFEQEIAALQKEDFIVKDGQHPKALNLYFQKRLSHESICILNKELSIFKYWTRKIRDTIIWPDVCFKIERYTPFVRYDRNKIKRMLKHQFSESAK